MTAVVRAEWRGVAERVEADDYVEYVNVTVDDVHVMQCNASNRHGYLFTNAFLNVLGTSGLADISH